MCLGTIITVTMSTIMVTRDIIRQEDTAAHVIEKLLLLNHKPFEVTQKAFLFKGIKNNFIDYCKKSSSTTIF